MRMMLTGAGGFIGSALARDLIGQGHEVVCLLRRDAPLPEGARALVLPEPWSSERLEGAIAGVGPAVLFHLAGGPRKDPETLYRDNVVIGERVMAAMDRVAPEARIVLTGSAAEYGLPDADGICREAAVPAPVNGYGIAKLALTRHAQLRMARGQRIVVARLFNPVGAGMGPGLAFGDFARRLVRDGDRLLTGDIDTRRDFFDVEEAARILLALALHPEAPGRIVNVCSGVATPVRSGVAHLVALAACRNGTAPRIERDATLGEAGVRSLRGATGQLEALCIRPATPEIGPALDALFAHVAATAEGPVPARPPRRKTSS